MQRRTTALPTRFKARALVDILHQSTVIHVSLLWHVYNYNHNVQVVRRGLGTWPTVAMQRSAIVRLCR